MINYAFIFLSGFASLVFQVLWMKQLGLLFGSTSQASAVSLAAFFAGLAAGSWYWGRKVGHLKQPLKLYAGLEAGIAVTALLYFLVLELFYGIYPFIYQTVHSSTILLIVKFALALLLIFPPAFCMGGTIPVMGQHLIRNHASFGSRAALLYGLNTIGAACGAGMAGFFLPMWLGFNGTCILAIVIAFAVAVAAHKVSVRSEPLPQSKQKGAAKNNPSLLWICFLSGFGVLALEVLWVRMFSQVLENSIYTYSAILVVVLICLSLGAMISSVLSRLEKPVELVLASLMLFSAFAITLIPFIFMELTDGLQIIASKGSWSTYILLIFKSVFLCIGLPALVLGILFPYLMKAEERRLRSAGDALGRLASVNTMGAILGALFIGFIALEQFGMWRSLQIIGGLYGLSVFALKMPSGVAAWLIRFASALSLVLLLTLLDPTQYPVVSVDSLRSEEKIHQIWEGSDATVSVVENPYGISIKVNSHYGLGSTDALVHERLQADIPLYIHPEAESIFFLGMGTGITAGSALDPAFKNVKRIVVCELLDDVIVAAKEYFGDPYKFDFTKGLFFDERAEILAEDGRHYLMASDESFDLIISDLFIPYRSGAGSLYSKEHFQVSLKRLNEGGLFVQWLPLYQLTEKEFSIIAKTMLEVFPQVTMWRNHFLPDGEIVALIGHESDFVLPANTTDASQLRAMTIYGKEYWDLDRLMMPYNEKNIPFLYCGNLSKAKELFESYPINTDNHPIIEYIAPQTYRNKEGEGLPWFTGFAFADLVDKVQDICPPESDSVLAKRDIKDKKLVRAANSFHLAGLWMLRRDEAKCKAAWEEFVKLWLSE